MTTATAVPRSPLRSGQFRRVVAAEFISSVGTQMTTLALPWFVLTTSGSPARMGLVFLIQILPVPLLSMPAGLLVARWGARRVTVVGDVCNAALSAAVPALYLADMLPFWALAVIVALFGCVASAYLSAQRMLLTETIGSDEGLVTAGNALFETATSTARLVGPAIAGFLIARFDALDVLWLDAVSFAVSAALLTGLPRRAPAPQAPPAHNMAEGVRYLVRDPVLRTMSLAVLGYGTLMPVVMLALPVLARTRYDADPHVAGWLLAAWGGGTALGTVAVARIARRVPPVRLAAAGGLGAALLLWFLPWDQPVTTLALTVAAGCMFLPGVTAPAVALMTLRPPEHLRPHVVPVFGAVVFVASPVAYGVAGLLFEQLAVGTVLTAVAVLASLCALLLLGLARRPGTR
ncbi:MFS transporter [Streptomyces rubradiris]|uniref:MFS transporter n=1 Tax=Streptomyces rubradiris TaxID=285531 RepID=A0ABQ3R816_STRRR|nr:MFS transporter [Streptomyces rubradiris]GHH24518.1 MFS transporter [Streptomyces rubradiris]GHI51997.1 MFS transporter [Streptomyces rubradiris]